MKLKQVLTILLLGVSSFLQFIPVVHAASPVVNGTQAKSCSNCSSAVSPSLISNSGDVLIVVAHLAVTVGSTVSTITDGGDTFTKIASKVWTSGANSVDEDREVWTTTTTQTPNVVITVTFSQSTNTVGVEFIDVSNLPNAAVDCTADGFGNSGTSATTTTSCAYNSATQLAVGSITSGDTTAATQSGWTRVQDLSAPCNNSCISFYNNGATSPVNFPWTIVNSAYWHDLGVVISSSSVTVTTIGPCTFFELQCWWYPLLFMGLYSGYILYVGQILKTSSRGKAHLFLSATTFGSLIAVIFGIMNIVFPLLMLILNTVIALRLRG